jgi:ribosomal protein L37AE/L43A
MMELMTSQELMRALKVSKSTLFRLKKMGLPTVGGGKLARYDPEKAIEWFDRNSHLTHAPEKLPPGDYECPTCHFQGIIQTAIAATKIGACQNCGSRAKPVLSLHPMPM